MIHYIAVPNSRVGRPSAIGGSLTGRDSVCVLAGTPVGLSQVAA